MNMKKNICRNYSISLLYWYTRIYAGNDTGDTCSKLLYL